MIDTHTHIDGEEFAEDRAQTVLRAQDAGVEKIFVPAIDLKSIGSVMDTCRQFPGYAYPMIGLHPEEVKEDWKDAVGQMRRILDEQRQKAPSADNPPFIAIGEVGLDFYWSREFEKEQLEAFEEQVRWSIEADLPLMIHCRKAQNEMVGILRRYERELRRGGVFHCFTGNEREAEQLLSFGNFNIGIGGVLTFKKSHLPEVVPHIPLRPHRARDRRSIHGSRADAREAQRECLCGIRKRPPRPRLRHLPRGNRPPHHSKRHEDVPA